MNGRAAAKAVGVYLALVGSVGSWIGGMVWAGVTDQNDIVKGLAISAPVIVLLVFLILGLVVWLPIASMYDHYNRNGGK